jgi:flagellar basal body-associated protein FliL
MNKYFKILIELMIVLVLLILVILGLFFANVTNFSFDNFTKEETPKTIKKIQVNPQMNK